MEGNDPEWSTERKKEMENTKVVKWHGKYNKKNQNMSNSRLERKKIECESIGNVIFEEITTNNCKNEWKT